MGEIYYEIELKTANTSYRMPGIQNLTRPITANIDGIIADATRLQRSKRHGIVSFLFFPIPMNDNRWIIYLQRIATAVGTTLSVKGHCARVIVPLGADVSAEAIVCCFSVSKSDGG